ncbi:MarR family winged helix-turn-helix transcriptional regulator [Aquimonas voraii]|uniref:DNA-binding transcriptional regulator, MarR family n=1 Tax=Aquimonas voraii TaxID=265719 RepID=A0A1G6S0R9_9GAMM|nr:MarR family winged helix-turn-helix transcriptional regulator [Aquimonas voraii]SDD09766.1 DNA-binding transcriptional regulator, MarR family [Aquimonas voraii]
MSKRKAEAAANEAADLQAGEMPAGTSRLDELLGLSLRRAESAASEVLAAQLNAHDSTPTRMMALMIVAERPGLKLVDLARALGIARSGAVVLVDELENRGQVKRRPMPGDRRAHSLVATPRGLKVLEKLVDVAKASDDKVFEVLGPRDRQTLLKLLSKIAPLPAA